MTAAADARDCSLTSLRQSFGLASIVSSTLSCHWADLPGSPCNLMSAQDAVVSEMRERQNECDSADSARDMEYRDSVAGRDVDSTPLI